MSREQLLSLAERVEKATGPDRELDLRIETATNPEYAGMDEAHAWLLVKYGGQRPFTASLDAAVTLVPEGLCWRLARRMVQVAWHCSSGRRGCAGPASLEVRAAASADHGFGLGLADRLAALRRQC
jgi:hypothetical protein